MIKFHEIEVDRPFSRNFIESWGQSICDSTMIRKSGPFFLVRDFWGRNIPVYIPFLSYTDLTPPAAFSLAQSVETNSFRIRFLSSESTITSGSQVVSRLILANKSVERVWESLASETRNRVRRAEKTGLSVATTDLKFFSTEFYDLYSTVQSRLGMPLLPQNFFRSLGETCETSLTMILHGKKSVACALWLKDEKLAWVPWICNTIEGRRLVSSDLLYWHLILQGFEEGLDIIDFGRSESGSGVCQFKQKWGCVAVPVVTLGFRSASIYKKYAFAQKIWATIPPSISANLSKKVISRLPDL